VYEFTGKLGEVGAFLGAIGGFSNGCFFILDDNVE
jgi:hypothetical protein